MAKKTTTVKAAKKQAVPAKGQAVKTKKQTAVKKAAAKTSAKKQAAPTKKGPAEKAPAKKVAAQKTPAKKVAKKQAAPAKKGPAAKAAKTTIIARVDVGFGNSLYIRGEGASLSWDKGVQLDNVSPYEWVFTTTKAKGDVNFKFLINDEIWSEGDDLSVAPGGTSISSPVFAW